MKRLLILFIISGISLLSTAQTPEDAVKQVVNNLFIAMKTGDTTLLKRCFADSAILQTVATDKNGKIFIQTERISDFADLVSQQVLGSLDERISFDIVKIDGQLAIVWAPYKFYFKTVFSHCGVDSFQLVLIKGEWKIQYLIDTRRKDKCE